MSCGDCEKKCHMLVSINNGGIQKTKQGYSNAFRVRSICVAKVLMQRVLKLQLAIPNRSIVKSPVLECQFTIAVYIKQSFGH